MIVGSDRSLSVLSSSDDEGWFLRVSLPDGRSRSVRHPHELEPAIVALTQPKHIEVQPAGERSRDPVS